MRINLKGINSITKRLADGTRRTYWYAWKGGPPLRARGLAGLQETACNQCPCRAQHRTVLARMMRPLNFLERRLAGPSRGRTAAARWKGTAPQSELRLDGFGDWPKRDAHELHGRCELICPDLPKVL